MVWLVWIVLGIAGAYAAIRYFLLKSALRKVCRELQEIRGDIEQNRILRLPLPDRELGKLLLEVNGMLEEVHRERQSFVRRERQFQEQIENISHDLRTPLTVILGYLKFAEKEAAEFIREPDTESVNTENSLSDAAEEQRTKQGMEQRTNQRTDQGTNQRTDQGTDHMLEMQRILGILGKNARILEHLVGQFYEFSQVSSENFAPELGKVDSNKTLREALAAHCQLLGGMALEVSLPEHPVTVLGEEQLLERIFLNLIRNAGQYGRSYLKVYMEESAREVRIIFENDTEKITVDEVPHLFDRFYRGDRARKSEGSGLGLAIARSLAQAAGGNLEGEAVRGEDGSAVVRFVLQWSRLPGD